jgi:hypothetical protein
MQLITMYTHVGSEQVRSWLRCKHASQGHERTFVFLSASDFLLNISNLLEQTHGSSLCTLQITDIIAQC